jgi:glycosyltransferase involved in cell wall biosynthesis
MHVVVGGDVGGAERLLVELATRPERTGVDHEVALVTPNRRLAETFTGAGLTVHDYGEARESPLAYLRQALGPAHTRWLAGLLGERRAALVHTHTFGSHVLGTRAARRAGVPQLRTEHHVMHYRDLSTSPFTRWAAARTERFVAVSDYVLRVLKRTAPAVARLTTVVRNGVDTARFAPLLGPRTGFRAAVVGRLTRWKRVHLAIEAAALADAELVVIGDGEERGALENLAARVGARAKFAGYQSDPRPLVAGCDVVLSTADDEPLGLSVLEALSMERPVIGYAGGGIPEIVEPGVTGWLVREPKAAAFAAAIREAKADPARLEAMGRAARARAVERFDVTVMCDGYRAQYASLLGRP